MRGMRAPSSMNKHVGIREPRKIDPTKPLDPSISSPTTDSPGLPSNLRGDLQGVPGPVVGRVPIQDYVLAGVSNNENLWALPPMQEMSPEGGSSDHGSVSGQGGQGQSLEGGTGFTFSGNGAQDDLMADIDWVCIHVRVLRGFVLICGRMPLMQSFRRVGNLRPQSISFYTRTLLV